jgi:hypothetical protein
MKAGKKKITFLVTLMAFLCPGVDASGNEVLSFYGASDASAAVPAGGSLFLLAGDEANSLKIYDSDRPGHAIGMFDLNQFLALDKEHPEADIEGAALIGSRAYWITSHGRNKDGKLRPNRYRFFANEIINENNTVLIKPVGQPYDRLLQDMISMDRSSKLGLEQAAQLDKELTKKEREKLAPKKEGINIEGLCASADGKNLYIGFRNPMVKNKNSGKKEAIVIPLLNAAGVVDHGATPSFGKPLLWDLGERGIRSMAYAQYLKTFFIIAGPVDAKGDFALYRWSGIPGSSPAFVKVLDELDRFSPEALVVFNDKEKMLLISDDGTLEVKITSPHECMKNELRNDGTCLNKHLIDLNKRTFRGIWLALPAEQQY